VNRGSKNSMRSADLVEDGGLQSLSASSSNYYLTFFNLPRPAPAATATTTATASRLRSRKLLIVRWGLHVGLVL